jgi:hypothetical protein
MVNPPRIIISPKGKPLPPKPKEIPKKVEKPLLTKCLELVVDDIKHIFHKDRKSIEEKMKHDEFMEQHFGGMR